MFRIREVLLPGTILLVTLFCTGTIAGEYDGYIYGKVKTRTGNTYTGLLRWGSEEAFWDDLFNSSKEDLPYVEYVERADLDKETEEMFEQVEELEQEAEEMEEEAELSESEGIDKREVRQIQRAAENLRKEAQKLRRNAKRDAKRMKKDKHYISILGGAINVQVNNWGGSRQFIARFGDIKKIVVIGSEDAEVTMKNGQMYVVSGYANDVGGKINVTDASLGDIELPWKKIETVEFMPTPSSVRPEGFRIKGKLVSDAGEFDGFIQWDSEECISTDKLDGDSEDGSVSIQMGTIKSIERRSRNSSKITLKDGRSLVLDGTNDVDSSIRGIYVEDPKYGRVKVSWESFERVDFYDKKDSGPGYNTYKTPTRLKGKVTDIDGNIHSGKIVFDIDESESWEMLNGDRFDVEYIIPFDRIASISPRSRSASMVVLHNNEKIRLDSSKDVSDSNDGVLIFTGEENDEYEYLEWDEIEVIVFD